MMSLTKYTLIMLLLCFLITCKKTTEPEMPPASPTQLAVLDVAIYTLSLSWSDNSDNEEYFLLERSDVNSTNFIEIVELSKNKTAYIDSALLEGTEYYYRIRAVRNNNLYSDYSNVISATTNVELPPNSPINLNASNIDYTTISLEWIDNSDDEEYFLLERAAGDSTQLTEIVELSSNTTTYIDSNLTRDTKYYYQIRAVRKGDIYSQYSNIADATTLISILEIMPFEIEINPNETYNQIFSLKDFEYPIFGVSFRVRYDDSIISVNDSTGFNIGNFFGNNSITFSKSENSKIYVTITLTQGDDKKTGLGELCRFICTGKNTGQTYINIQNDEIVFYDENGNTVITPDFKVLSSKTVVK